MSEFNHASYDHDLVNTNILLRSTVVPPFIEMYEWLHSAKTILQLGRKKMYLGLNVIISRPESHQVRRRPRSDSLCDGNN